ncbi:MAG: hypothetical protein ACP5P3_03560 [Ignavibacteria bacterium]
MKINLKIILYFTIAFFFFIGSNCDNLLQSTSGSVEGTWELVKMEGNLQDVCLGEIATLSGGSATLQCPGKTPVVRQYTYQNNVLTYTSTGVSYDVSFFTDNSGLKMQLHGRGIERVLTYLKTN